MRNVESHCRCNYAVNWSWKDVHVQKTGDNVSCDREILEDTKSIHIGKIKGSECKGVQMSVIEIVNEYAWEYSMCVKM